MRNFFEETYMNINLQRKLIKLISEISEFKGKISVYQSKKYPVFNDLEQAIPLQYMKKFITMNQDIHVPNTKIKEFIVNDTPPKTKEEDAVYCYYQTLSFVYNQFNVLSISPETIQELHFQLLHYSTSDCGIWRHKPFTIPGFSQYDKHVSSYQLLPHEQVQQSVKELCK